MPTVSTIRAKPETGFDRLLRWVSERGADAMYTPGTSPHQQTEEGIGQVLRFMSPVDADTGMPGDGPVGALDKAVVLSLKTAPGIRKAMREAVRAGGNADDVAIAYMRAKHPRLASIPDEIRVSNALRPRGEYKVLADGAWNLSGQAVMRRGAPNPVETLAHELTHGMQTQRIPGNAGFWEYKDKLKYYRNAVKSTINHPSHGLDRMVDLTNADIQRWDPTINPVRTDDVGNTIDDIAYWWHPHEVKARRGGRTALETYKQLDKLAPYDPIQQLIDKVVGMKTRFMGR